MMIAEYKRVKRKGKNLAKKSRVMAYAKAVSNGGGDYYTTEDTYTVVRYHDRTYGCNCPSQLFRRWKRCKHIKDFIKHERGE